MQSFANLQFHATSYRGTCFTLETHVYSGIFSKITCQHFERLLIVFLDIHCAGVDHCTVLIFT